MKITRTSPLSGEHTFDLRICQAQVDDHKNGRKATSAFANLEPWELQFYLTGYTLEDAKRLSGVPIYEPGDRINYAGEDGFVLRVETVPEGQQPQYVLKLNGKDEVIAGVPETSVNRPCPKTKSTPA